jgi:phosphoribosylformylglycinamidine synthase
MKVIVEVMLKPEILDPQGGAILAALPRLGMSGVRSVRQGKRFELDLDLGVGDEPDLEQIHRIADGLLSNPVIEDYVVHIPDHTAG